MKLRYPKNDFWSNIYPITKTNKQTNKKYINSLLIISLLSLIFKKLYFFEIQFDSNIFIY